MLLTRKAKNRKKEIEEKLKLEAEYMTAREARHEAASERILGMPRISIWQNEAGGTWSGVIENLSSLYYDPEDDIWFGNQATFVTRPTKEETLKALEPFADQSYADCITEKHIHDTTEYIAVTKPVEGKQKRII